MLCESWVLLSLVFLVLFPTLMQCPRTLELISTQLIIQGGASEDPKVFFSLRLFSLWYPLTMTVAALVSQ